MHHIAGYPPPLPTTVRALHFFHREKPLALSSARRLASKITGSIWSALDFSSPLCPKTQALAQATKSARERDANPGAVRGPKLPGLTKETLLQTHISVMVVR